jgi:hypothetical protein
VTFDVNHWVTSQHARRHGFVNAFFNCRMYSRGTTPPLIASTNFDASLPGLVWLDLENHVAVLTLPPD